MSNVPSQAWPNRLRVLIPLGIFLIAFGFRLIGIGWGLPNQDRHWSLNPDEPVIFGYSQAVEPLQYPWTPHFYNYGTLYLVVLRVASDMTAAYTGGVDPQKPESLYGFMGRSHFAGRIVNALAGAGMAVIVFLILRRFASEFGAVLGGLFIAFAPAHVVHSRLQTVDIFAAFLLTVSAFYALRALSPDEALKEDAKGFLRDAALSGVFAGLSAGTKYIGILGLLTLYAVVLLSGRPEKWKAACLATGAAFLSFLVVTPGLIVDSAKFWQDVRFEMGATKTGHGTVFAGTANGYVVHFFNLFLGIGAILTLGALAGLAYAASKRKPWALALLAFALPYFLLIGSSQDKYMRYTFPLYIAMAVGFGWAMGKAHERKGWWHIAVAGGMLGLGGLDFGGLAGAARLTAMMADEDVRDTVGRRFREMPREVVVGLANDPWFYTPTLYPDAQQMRGPYSRIDAAMRAAHNPRVERFIPRGPDGGYLYPQRIQWDARLLTETKPDYVTISSFELSDVTRLSHVNHRRPEEDSLVSQYESFKAELDRGYVLDARYGPGIDIVEDMMYVAPTEYVWKRKDLP